jgi:MFS family permease
MSGGGTAGWLAARLAPLRGGGRGWVLLTVAAGWFATLGLRFVIPALLPRIKETFDASNAAAGLAVTVIWLTYAGMQLPAGALVDRVGERVLLTASLLLFGFLPTFALFLATAALFGLGTGLFGPPRGTVLANTFTDNDGAAFGATLAAGSVGAAVLPFVATWVSVGTAGRFGGWAGWQVALASFAPLFFVLAGGVWWALPGRDERRRATDHAASADVEPDGGRRHSRAVLGAATARPVVIATLGGTFMLFTLQGLTAFFTTYLVEVKGFSEGVAGGLFSLLFLAGAGFQAGAGRVADRYGHRTVLVAIAVLGIPPLVVIPLVDGLAAFALLTVVLGIRIAVGPVLNAYLVGILPTAVQGSAWGLIRTTFFGIGATGSLAVGVVADAGRFDLAIYGLAALTIPAIAIFALVPARETAAA